jgi:hypothetical protein
VQKHQPLSSLFQTLLKKAKEAENENFYIGVGNHPEEAVDAEVVRIVNENLADPDGLEATKIVPGASTDGTDRAGESEV